MRVVITGAGGLMGKAVVSRLLQDRRLGGRPIDQLRLADLSVPVVPSNAPFEVEASACDVSDRAQVRELLADGADFIFHFAAIMSGAAERQYEKGWSVNMDGTRNVLDASAASGRKPTIVFTSTIALYGREVQLPVVDDCAIHPETPYGTQKLIMELMLEDYTRRGLVDARIMRVPHVAIREDDYHQGAGGFITAVLKAPIHRRDATCPVPRETEIGITTPEVVLESLFHIANLPASSFGERRVVQLPATTLSVGEMIDALAEFVGPEALAHIRYAPDPELMRLLSGLPASFTADRARKLGFPSPPLIGQVISEYLLKAGVKTSITAA